MQPFQEPFIMINGKMLSQDQAETIRLGIEALAGQLVEVQEKGRSIDPRYFDHINDLRGIIYIKAEEKEAA